MEKNLFNIKSIEQPVQAATKGEGLPGVNGAEEMGVRASIWSSVFIIAAGAPGGVRLPWARQVES